MGKFIDMTGWKMWEHGVPDSRLTVLERAEDYVSPSGGHVEQWLCQCECGSNPIVVSKYRIKNGQTKSCGCLKRERVSNANRKINQYDLSGEYGIGWTTNTNVEFYFDLKDYDTIKEYTWYEYVNPKTKYHSLRTRERGTRKNILMTDLLGCKFYDHIDRNPLNCRRNNLREVTQQQNTVNKSKMSNNTSGITGVSWDKQRQLWAANICKNYHRVWLGWFQNKDDAIIARLNAEVKYYGEFAPQKHLFKQYKITTPQND